MSIVNELKRRNVFRVAIAYLAGAWLLIQVVETLFPVYGLSDASIRLVVTLLAIGFPLILIFSWVFELTPQGFRLEKDIDQSATLTHGTGRNLDRFIIAVLALALGFFAFDKFVLEPGRLEEIAQTAARTGAENLLKQQEAKALPENSIAVLPFTNMSPNLSEEYFSDGLTEELIGALAKINGLHVTARTSAFAFKGEHRDIRDIGKILSVKTVLEGSVRREESQVRITAQLIDVENGFHLWSDTFNYEMESVLALQEAISRAIVTALQIQLSPQVDEQLRTKVTVNPEAYDLYLKGRYYWARLSMGGFQQSLNTFQKAIAIDPEYAPSHAGLANAYSFAGFFGLMPPRDAFPLSIMEADTALALDPSSSEALVARGMAALLYEWNWDRARDDLNLALELSPNLSLAHWAYAEYLTVVNPPAALDSALRALSLDPLSLPIMNMVSFTYLDQGMFAEAAEINKEMIALDPGFAGTYWGLGVIHMLQGRLDEALEKLAQSVESSGGMPSTLAMQAHAYARSGDEASALSILAKLEDLRKVPGRGYASPMLIAYGYEGLGRAEDAFNWLELAIEERDGWLVFLNSFPRFESLRNDPRFAEILHQVGLPDRGD